MNARIVPVSDCYDPHEIGVDLAASAITERIKAELDAGESMCAKCASRDVMLAGFSEWDRSVLPDETWRHALRAAEDWLSDFWADACECGREQ